MNLLRLLVFYLTVTGCFGRKRLFIVLFSRDSVWNIFIRVGIYFRDSLYLCGIIKSISMKLTHGYYHLIAILTVAIWGLTFIATKVLINHGLTPQEIFFYRFLIAYIGIWAISPKHLFADNLKDELWLVAGGVFGGSLYFFTENTALGITQASNVDFIIFTAPLLTTILSMLF